jgi:valyl-tRNA synthetase
MSKSKGNVVNPIDLIDTFGCDALRIALVVGNTPGMDLALSRDRIKGYKNFANKLWNITRFVMTSIEDKNFSKITLNESDQKIMSEFDSVITDITTDMENFRFYMTSEKIYHYIWDTFASIIIEESKPILMGDDEELKKSRQTLLIEILEKSLKILHPFMPFVTEEIWSIIPASSSQGGPTDNKKLLMVEKWPASPASQGEPI